MRRAAAASRLTKVLDPAGHDRLVIQLETSPAGAGAAHFEVHRGAPFVSGVRFDAEFRVLGADGSELLSECVTVTVK